MIPDLKVIDSRYRKKYLVPVEDFSGKHWEQKSDYLSLKKIGSAYANGNELGYFQATTTSMVVVDIDDHSISNLKADTLTPILIKKYADVCRKFGIEPTAVFKSPRGLHAYYHTNQTVPTKVYSHLAFDRLRGSAVEVRPTTNTGLRMPIQERALNPHTLKPTDRGTQSIKRIDACYLFDADYLPNNFKRFVKSDKVKQTEKLAQLESRINPVKGSTNDELVRFSLASKKAGLTAFETASRFSSMLKSNHYIGELQRFERLLSRVNWAFKNQIDFATPQNIESQLTFNDFEIIQNIGQFAENSKVRKPLEKLTEGILEWRAFILSQYAAPEQRAVFQYLYPYFTYNVSRGLIPLPQTILKRENSRYNEKLPSLINSGLLEPSGLPYVPSAGICKHYRIATNLSDLKGV